MHDSQDERENCLMKAAVYRRYGPPDIVVRIEDVEKPAPKDDEVLIRVHAASVNPYDWHFMRGTPYFLRMMTGVRRPKFTGIGVDAAGEVEAVGKNVAQFKPGDKVFGACRGAFAEYTCASQARLVPKPDNVTFEQAASVPIAAISALQGLRDKGHVQHGQKVLINGAAGGVGTFAVQIAKSFGANVTGVCSARNAEMVRSIGADEVIDYAREDFTKSGQHYDVILDCVGNHSLLAYRRVLNPKGIYVVVGGSSSPWMIRFLARLIAGPVLSLFVSQNMGTLGAKIEKKDLIMLRELLGAGKVKPVIDKSYGLREVPDAIRYLEKGHARGKVVITLEDSNKN